MMMNNNPSPSLKSGAGIKRKRCFLGGNITDNIVANNNKNSSSCQGPARKVVRVTSALPDRLIKSNANIPSPQQVLDNIYKKQSIPTNQYSFTDIPQFFQQTTEEEMKSYDFDVLQAIRKGDIEQLRNFHQAGRPLNCSNSFGESLLHLACRKGLVQVVDFLINDDGMGNNVGVPVQVVDDMGRTPLHDAFWTPEPNFELIDLLVSKCPDLLLVKDKRGHTPLSYTRKAHWSKWNEYLQSRADRLGPNTLSERKQ